jgi:hypothetical protein
VNGDGSKFKNKKNIISFHQCLLRGCDLKSQAAIRGKFKIEFHNFIRSIIYGKIFLDMYFNFIIFDDQVGYINIDYLKIMKFYVIKNCRWNRMNLFITIVLLRQELVRAHNNRSGVNVSERECQFLKNCDFLNHNIYPIRTSICNLLIFI